MAKQATILIVEDKEPSMRLFRDILGAQGYEIIEIRDGRLAHGRAVEFEPDLIIMDIQLPGISGLDAIQQIKQDHTTKDIPILAVSAFAMEEEVEKIKEYGADYYISKPVRIKVLTEIVTKVLS